MTGPSQAQQRLRGSIPRPRVAARPDRGSFFVKPTDPVYVGMIVGEHCRDNDIDVNVAREKKLTNMRAASADKTVVLKPPRILTLELALEFIEDDELVELTPRRHPPPQAPALRGRPPPGRQSSARVTSPLRRS
jgi:hypothetical protein